MRLPKNPTCKIINIHARPRMVSKIKLPSTPAASTNGEHASDTAASPILG
jgi:hypothetical protein